MQIRVVDAFAAKAFSGNPAGVCLLDGAAPEPWMQNVARELNLAETAFLFREGDGFQLRWFTPAVEVALCGHATLASAHILWQDGLLPAGKQARFQTKSGLLTADRDGDWIKLDFPAAPSSEVEPPPGLLAALGVERARYVGRNIFDYIVELDSEDVVRSLTPDLAALATIETRGVIVTSRASTDGFDFISRFFAPAVGIAEDPVTGSAHCCLTPYWAAQLGRTEMVGYQASARGGVVKVALRGERVWMFGQAITVWKGELLA